MKEHNTANCEHYFRKKYRNKIWHAWQKTRYNARMKKIKAEEAKDVLKSIKQKRALQKMHMRAVETMRVRDSWTKFHD